jgi:hypothetical protein
MDVFGKAPTAPEGEYFRNNVWWWRPLAELCCFLAPDICSACEHWQSNDGDGLDAEGAAQLGAVLEARIKSGEVAAYVRARDKHIAGLPHEPCDLCNATGIRTDDIGRAAGHPERIITEPADHPRLNQKGWCNACDGRGTREPWDAHYPCNVENVAEFAAFCKASGGFSIC